jgi:hypothetical protein
VSDDAVEEMLWVDPEAPAPPVGEQKFSVVYALLAGTYRGLELDKRVPALMRSRGWPADNDDLRSVIAVAAALVVIGATATIIRRPPAADALRGAWPAESGSMTAGQVVASLDLQSLTVEF